SFLPPQNSGATQSNEGWKRANSVLAQAKTARTYEEFGLLAEKVSDDDFRVNLGDHRVVARDTLPPQVVNAFLVMQTGQISDIIQVERAYTIVRLNAHVIARKQSFEEVKRGLRVELQKTKYEGLRQELDRHLRAKAKIELL